MVVAARLLPNGVHVRFADDREGIVPFERLALPGPPRSLAIPLPHTIELHLQDGTVEELPWDFARHFTDPEHRRRSEAAGRRGRDLLADRLRAARKERRMSQEQLAGRAGISRVTIARIETGEQLPRYGTLSAIADGLDVPIERLLTE
jgi:DNA-binding XRE family transcriptional regulator